jgi:hypothetical protein
MLVSRPWIVGGAVVSRDPGALLDSIGDIIYGFGIQALVHDALRDGLCYAA